MKKAAKTQRHGQSSNEGSTDRFCTMHAYNQHASVIKAAEPHIQHKEDVSRHYTVSLQALLSTHTQHTPPGGQSALPNTKHQLPLS
jgi:hypothetical protein